MDDKKYYAIVTDIGAAAISNAALVGEKVNITELAVGDGGGAYYRPTADMTALKGERWRGNITSYEVDEFSPNVIVVKTVVPYNVGGFTMREMGLYDDSGRLITIENLPEVEKVRAESGASFDFEITTRVVVSNNSALNYVFDPTTVMATKKNIEEHNTSAKAHENRFAKIASDMEKEFEPIHLHMEDMAKHVTQSEKNMWNMAAGETDGLSDAVLNVGTKVETVNNKLGAAADTGGTATAGSVFAKLNALLSKFTSTWTNARAGYLDYLANGTYGLNAIKTAVSANSTKLGNIERDLNGLAVTQEEIKDILSPTLYNTFDKVVFEYATEYTTTSEYGHLVYFGKFIAPKDSCYKLSFEHKGYDSNNLYRTVEMFCYNFPFTPVVYYTGSAIKRETLRSNGINFYSLTMFQETSGLSTSSISYIGSVNSILYSSSTYKTETCGFYAKKGQMIAFNVYVPRNGYIRNQKIVC